MTLRFENSARLDEFLALYRELAGRSSWATSLMQHPVEPAIAAFLDGLRGWRLAGRHIPPPELVRDDLGDDAASRSVRDALDAARAELGPALAAQQAARAQATSPLRDRRLVERLGPALVAALGTSSAGLEIPLYLVPFAPFPPAVGLLFAQRRVVGAFIDCGRYHGSVLAEAALTQLAWACVHSDDGPDALLRRLRALLPGDQPYPRRLRLELLKVLIEVTAGHLIAADDPSHRMCVDLLGTAWRFPRLYALAGRHWRRYLEGHTEREEALSAVAREARQYHQRWYLDTVDGAALAADFYLLVSMAADGDDAARARLAWWAPQLCADLARQLDLIIGTELGHYQAARLDSVPAGLREFLRSVNVEDSRAGWWRARQELGELAALDLARQAFAGPGVEYGGEAWAPIAAMVRRFSAGELPARVFLDQCFTLQHNNGSLFDKYFDVQDMLTVLEAQAGGDLVTLARHASTEVRARWQRHSASVVDRVPPQWTRLGIGTAPPGVLGCGSGEDPPQYAPADAQALAGAAVPGRALTFRRAWPARPRAYHEVTAVLRTDLGDIELRLWPDLVPFTVDNFVTLAQGSRSWRDPATGDPRQEPFYDGTTFYRRVAGFAIFGGDRTPTGRAGPGYRIPDEFVDGFTFDRPFLVGMANAGRDSAGSRFLITLTPAPHLDGSIVAFGEVTNDASRSVASAIGDSPTPVTLHRVDIHGRRSHRSRLVTLESELPARGAGIT
jgi:cyclophilin family peptidyl-prolyl cis-trans isomerase